MISVQGVLFFGVFVNKSSDLEMEAGAVSFMRGGELFPLGCQG